MHYRRIGVTLAGFILMLSGSGAVAQSQASSSIEEIRRELMQLPYYGVFDFIAFSYEKGTVTLTGYAYSAQLKADAERAVKRATGVDQVKDKIEELPTSPTDDELRWRAYYTIYRDPFLSRYAPGGGMLWGHSHALGGPALRPYGPGPFLGLEAAGNYPIHIIVKNGRITLLGVVDNESDKTTAGIKAREVKGSFGVENDLMVENTRQSTNH
jgi:hyperosmotically inducible protein